MTAYDRWKTATPPEYDLECCDECNGDSVSDCCGAEYDSDWGFCMDCKEHSDAAGCTDEDCQCHATDDGDAGYDAWKDDQLTEV